MSDSICFLIRWMVSFLWVRFHYEVLSFRKDHQFLWLPCCYCDKFRLYLCLNQDPYPILNLIFFLSLAANFVKFANFVNKVDKSTNQTNLPLSKLTKSLCFSFSTISHFAAIFIFFSSTMISPFFLPIHQTYQSLTDRNKLYLVYHSSSSMNSRLFLPTVSAR